MSRACKLMRLGISSYAYVWWAGVPGFPAPAAPLTVDDLFDQAVSLGVRVVQIADNLPLGRLSASERRRLAAKARELGIQVEAGTRGAALADMRQRLERLKRETGWKPPVAQGPNSPCPKREKPLV